MIIEIAFNQMVYLQNIFGKYMKMRNCYFFIVLVVSCCVIPIAYGEQVKNDVGTLTIDNSNIEITTDSEELLKIYGVMNSSNKGTKGNIVITLPDGSTDGLLFIPTNDGYFESFYTITGSSEPGHYKILGTYGSQIIGSLEFTVSEKVFSVDDLLKSRNSNDEQIYQKPIEQEKDEPTTIVENDLSKIDVIKISDSGGDCNLVGKWNAGSRTCTLTQDVEHYLRIDGSNLTLDGNGHHMLLDKEHYIYNLSLGSRQINNISILILGSDVILKNIIVEGFTNRFNEDYHPNSIGVVSHQTQGTKVMDSEFYGHFTGIGCLNGEVFNNDVHSNYNKGVGGENCKIFNNNIFDNPVGISLIGGNTVENNILTNNRNTGILIKYQPNTITNNLIQKSPSPVKFSGGDPDGNKIFNNNFIQYDPTSSTIGNKIGSNYWDLFDSKSEGCIDSHTNNFCQSPLIVGSIQDSKPWKIQNGWLYEISIPSNIRLNSDSSDGTRVDYSVSAKGPDDTSSVTCTPPPNSIFPIGNTEVICSMSNGIVSAFSVTVIDSNLIIEKQNQENYESGLIGFFKVLSFLIAVFLIILLIKAKSRKDKIIKKAQSNRQHQYHSRDEYSQNSHQQASQDNTQSNSGSKSNDDSKEYDLHNLSIHDAFEILEVNENSTSKEIIESRNHLIKQWHPDKHKTPLYQKIAEKQAKLIIASFELLKNSGYVN
jgi:parallel beta-helix repeat protein